MKAKNGNGFPIFEEDSSLIQKMREGIERKVKRQIEEEMSHQFAKDVVKYSVGGRIDLQPFLFQGERMSYEEFVRRWSNGKWVVIGSNCETIQQQTKGENENS